MGELDVVIELLQLYVGFSLLIALISYVMHGMPVFYAIRNYNKNSFFGKRYILAFFAYIIPVFLIAPKVAIVIFTGGQKGNQAYKRAIYEILKDV